MGAKSLVPLFIAWVFFVNGCALIPTELPARIVLLAPFEGRYREVGYNAYYAIRLAFADVNPNIEFLPIDDGGSVSTAVERAYALTLDPQVRLALILGYSATDAATQHAFGDIPLIIIGHWSAQPQRDGVFMLAAPTLDSLITAPSGVEVTEAARLDAPVVGGEVFALLQFPMLRDSLENIIVVSSASLPDADFRERYLASAEFAPEPGLLATLSYDAARIALEGVMTSTTRAEVTQALSTIQYDGLNGTIRFENGYWADAPIFTYASDENSQLVPIEGIVEQR